jgi:predicted phage terminase large subunit-like protein
MREIRFNYGKDPLGQGFYWAASEQKRKEWLNVKRNSPMLAESVYQCRPGSREGVIFMEGDFCNYDPPIGLEMGVGSPNVKRWLDGTGAFVVQSWDTAFSANKDSDYTVCVTALLVPCEHYHREEKESELGQCESHFDLYVLDVYREQIPWADVTPMARSQFMKWLPSVVVIEQTAYGAPLIENLSKAGVPIEPIKPMLNKRARAIEGVGAGSVQGWFRLHRVKFPFVAPWFEGYMTEFKDFTGERGNRDDQVDATINLVQHAIKAGGSSVLLPTGWATPDQVDIQMAPPRGILGEAAAMAINWGETDFDPFEMTCGRCRNYTGTARKHDIQTKAMRDKPNDFCMIHNNRLPIIASCDQFAGTDELLSLSRY